MAEETKKQDEIFDYRTLRLLVGIVAFALPIVVLVATLFAKPPVDSLDSISASYWVDEARDLFVGGLFIIATLMAAYNGHDPGGDETRNNGSAAPHPLMKWLSEKWAAKVVALMAIGVALFPTRCSGCERDTDMIIHYVSAILLFTIITYFCLGSFRKRALEKALEADRAADAATGAEKKKQQEIAYKTRRRATIYLVCGWTIIISLVLAFASGLPGVVQVMGWWTLFLGELFALWAFGVSWFTAAKVVSPLAQKDERLQLV